MATISVNPLLEVLNEIELGTVKYTPQGVNYTYYPMLKKEDGLIDFNKSAQQIFNLIRGLYIWPNAYFYLENKMVKIFNSKVVDFNSNVNVGEIAQANKTGFIIKCGDNSFLSLLDLQIEGGKRLNFKDFLNGNKLEVGTKLNGNIIKF